MSAVAVERPVTQEGKPITTAMLKEMVTGLTSPMFNALKISLPRYIDDIERDLGTDIYDQMLRDAQIAADFETLRLSILSEGYRVAPAVDPVPATAKVDAETKARSERALEYSQFIERNLNGMDGAFLLRLHDMLLGLAQGHRVAEVTCNLATDGEDKGRLVLTDVRPKPRSNVSFVVDQLGKLVGILAIQPEEGQTTLPQVFGMGSETWAHMLPVEKFVIFTNNERDGLPLGSSTLRPAYTPWYIKKNILPDWYKFLRQFGTPAIIGITGDTPTVNSIDKATGELLLDLDGNPKLISAVYDLLQTLLAWQNSAAMALPFGATVELVESKTDGAAFDHAQRFLNAEISKSILGTAQVSLEAQHESRSSKGVGQDVFGLRVSWNRQCIGFAFTRLFRYLIVQNFGASEKDLTPMLVLTKAKDEDRIELMKGIATLRTSGTLPDLLVPQALGEVGFDIDLEVWQDEQEQKREREEMIAGNMGKVMNPKGTAPAKDDEDPGGEE